ncbi:MAG: radical SAM protein [Alphaproteobacteria bacterium]|nr:radical SAM protein [Alphaproteobacteria bacterium]
MPDTAPLARLRIDPRKFQDPTTTADGQARATVGLAALKTLWFNTGTLCNIACRNCYIESSPRNDRLAYLTFDDIRQFLDEIERDGLATEEIGFTGGEPFMNSAIIEMLDLTLARGFRALVLTNAMLPMRHRGADLGRLRARHGERLGIRVSLDHYSQAGHEAERGEGTWRPAIRGLKWLFDQGFCPQVAGRSFTGESEADLRAGYARLFRALAIAGDAAGPPTLVLFPEMDATADVPEITTACWRLLDKSPSEVMCATSRMVVRRKGAPRPSVVACTLLPYDPRFELGATLADARQSVSLNHPHCATFCVLGGASCSKP